MSNARSFVADSLAAQIRWYVTSDWSAETVGSSSAPGIVLRDSGGRPVRLSLAEASVVAALVREAREEAICDAGKFVAQGGELLDMPATDSACRWRT